MSVQFQPGQEVRLQLPGGVYRANVLRAGEGDKEWVLHVPDENPVRRYNGRSNIEEVENLPTE